MTFTENLYLKRQLQQLQGENLKLKKILSEQNETPDKTPKDIGDGVSGAIRRVFDERRGRHFTKMTEEEAFQHGIDHGLLPAFTIPSHFFKNPHFAAGFNYQTLGPQQFRDWAQRTNYTVGESIFNSTK